MLKPKKDNAAVSTRQKIDAVVQSEGKFITEEELAQLLGLSVKDAVKLALEKGLSRIKVKRSRYYSKKQVCAYLAGERVVKE